MRDQDHPPAPTTTWGGFLRTYTDRPGWSVARLARESSVGKSTIFRWIAGKGGLTVASVRAIAAALGVDLRVAMLAAGDVLGLPDGDDPEVRHVMAHPKLTIKQKAEYVAIIRARRARDLDTTVTMIEQAIRSGDVGRT